MRSDGSRGVPVHAPSSALLLPVNLAIAVVSSYLALLTLAGWRAFRASQRRGVVADEARHRFAVLIPAHNEEQLIGSALKSLAEADYPTTHYAVHVVADNCSDATAEVAALFGAKVHERHAPDDPGKGPALSWLLERLREQGEAFDAVALIDADSVVSRNFLRVMDARLGAGERAIQGYYAVRDEDRSWVTAMRAAALAVRHYLSPLARTSLGGSAGLRGNGMVFAEELMRSRRWSGHLTEDLEFESQLLLDGDRVGFAPEAVVQAEMPERLADARTQNERWEGGRLDLARRYVPSLMRASLRRQAENRFACADAAVDHMVPPLSVVVGATALAGTASVVLLLLRSSRLSRVNAALALGSAAIQGGYLASALRMVGAPAVVWRSLLRLPVYLPWKLSIWLRAALAGGTPAAWIRTPRNSQN